MTRDELLRQLRECVAHNGDPEAAHWAADAALVEFIADPEVAATYNDVKKWYS